MCPPLRALPGGAILGCRAERFQLQLIARFLGCGNILPAGRRGESASVPNPKFAGICSKPSSGFRTTNALLLQLGLIQKFAWTRRKNEANF
jgi:hypothetical protein